MLKLQILSSSSSAGQWIDDLSEPLEIKEDVEELFRMVDGKIAKRKAEAIRKAVLN